MKQKRPTLAQESILREYGLEPLPTAASTALLINFIKNGNHTDGSTVRERINIWNESRARLLGKRVASNIYAGDSDHGVIERIIPRSAKEVMCQIKLDINMLGQQQKRAPFKLYVQWDTGTKTTVAISSVIIEDYTNIEVKLPDKPLKFRREEGLYLALTDEMVYFCIWFNTNWHINRYGFRADCAQGVIPQNVRNAIFTQFIEWASANNITINGKLCTKHSNSTTD